MPPQRAREARSITFDVKLPYAALWRMDPEKRPFSAWGIIGTANVPNLMAAYIAAPYSTFVPIARGARPVGPLLPMEYRATIRGGLAALRGAGVKGYTRVSVDKLDSRIVQSKRSDDALVAAAGQRGKSLKTAARHIQRVVSREKLDRPAFAARALYILANAKGFDLYAKVVFAIASAAGAREMKLVEMGRALADKTRDAQAKAFLSAFRDGVRAAKMRRLRADKRAETSDRQTTAIAVEPPEEALMPSEAESESVEIADTEPADKKSNWPWIAGGLLLLIGSLLYRRR